MTPQLQALVCATVSLKRTQHTQTYEQNIDIQYTYSNTGNTPTQPLSDWYSMYVRMCVHQLLHCTSYTAHVMHLQHMHL